MILPALLLAAGATLTPQTPAAGALQRAVDSVRTDLDVRGVAVALVLPDGTTWQGVSGEAYAGVPVTPATAFEIASITKTFTGGLAVLLARDGVLALDATIEPWLPNLPNAAHITIRQLLTHTSGLDDVFTQAGFIPRIIGNPARVWSAPEVLALVGDADFPPGEGWGYSSSGFVAAGVIMEAVGGAPLAELYRRHLFGPLGMTRTFYGGIETVTEPAAHAFYDFNNDGVADDLSLVMPATALRTAAGPAGALISTAADLASGIRALATPDFLGAPGFAAFTTFVDRPDGHRYGLGLLRIELDGTILVGHRGNSVGFSAEAWHAPERGVTITVLTNRHGIAVTPFVSALLEVLARAG
jgi:CubicO group peptidase (beta-lactamase class C family)